MTALILVSSANFSLIGQDERSIFGIGLISFDQGKFGETLPYCVEVTLVRA